MTPEIEFVTLNTHLGLHPKRNNFAPNDLVSACLALDADIIALQEHFRPAEGTALIDHLGEAGYEVAEHAMAPVRWTRHGRPRLTNQGPSTWGLALASRYPIVSTRILPIGRVIRDPAGHRSALAVELDVDGTRLDVIVVHTSSKVPYGPVIHLRRLRSQLPVGAGPVIVAGDCNIWGPVATRVLPGWRRAVVGRTWPAHRPHSQIDHILVNDRIEVVRGQVLADHGSDHRPVKSRLRLM